MGARRAHPASQEGHTQMADGMIIETSSNQLFRVWDDVRFDHAWMGIEAAAKAIAAARTDYQSALAIGVLRVALAAGASS